MEENQQHHRNIISIGVFSILTLVSVYYVSSRSKLSKNNDDKLKQGKSIKKFDVENRSNKTRTSVCIVGAGIKI